MLGVLPNVFVGIGLWRATGMRLGGQLTGGFAMLFQPGVDGRPAAAQEAGDHGRMFALVDELNGAATPAFEFFCSSDRSHTTTTELHRFCSVHSARASSFAA